MTPIRRLWKEVECYCQNGEDGIMLAALQAVDIDRVEKLLRLGEAALAVDKAAGACDSGLEVDADYLLAIQEYDAALTALEEP